MAKSRRRSQRFERRGCHDCNRHNRYRILFVMYFYFVCINAIRDTRAWFRAVKRMFISISCEQLNDGCVVVDACRRSIPSSRPSRGRYQVCHIPLILIHVMILCSMCLCSHSDMLRFWGSTNLRTDIKVIPYMTVNSSMRN